MYLCIMMHNLYILRLISYNIYHGRDLHILILISGGWSLVIFSIPKYNIIIYGSIILFRFEFVTVKNAKIHNKIHDAPER